MHFWNPQAARRGRGIAQSHSSSGPPMLDPYIDNEDFLSPGYLDMSALRRSDLRLRADKMEVEFDDYLYTTWAPSTEEEVKWSTEDWWRHHTGRWPAVEDVARRRLSAQASSAASERSFSKAGLIATKKRIALSTENVDRLSVLSWDAAFERQN